MKFELLHPADQLVMIMQRIYEYGMTTTSGGNLSIRDENGDIWITPSGIDKGALTRADIMQVKPDGTVIGPHTPSVELPIHRNIYKLRPDLRAIVHAHPPILVAFSLVRQVPDTKLIPNANLVCGKVAMAKYDVPGSEQLGANIAEQFAAGYNTVLMENHGVVCGAPDLYHAFMAFETITFSAKIELDARKLGTPRQLTDAQIAIDSSKAHPPLDSFEARVITSEERAGRRDLCTLIHRSYDQRLFTSTQGTFSMRLSDGSLLITPYMKDRKYLEPEDIVRVKNGMGELGKVPPLGAAASKDLRDAPGDQFGHHRPSAGHHGLRGDGRGVRLPPDPGELHLPARSGPPALRRHHAGRGRRGRDVHEPPPGDRRGQPVRDRDGRVAAQRL